MTVSSRSGARQLPGTAAARHVSSILVFNVHDFQAVVRYNCDPVRFELGRAISKNDNTKCDVIDKISQMSQKHENAEICILSENVKIVNFFCFHQNYSSKFVSSKSVSLLHFSVTLFPVFYSF